VGVVGGAGLRRGVVLVADAVALLDDASRVFDGEGDAVSRDAVNQAAHALVVCFPEVPFAGLRQVPGGGVGC
jgi:hypothetical protein